MNFDNDSFFSAVPTQESAPFDPNYSLIEALLGVRSIDSMPSYLDFDLAFPSDYLDYNPSPADLVPSGEVSSPPLSPLSSADSLDLPFVKVEAMPAKADLEFFEYNPITRKWVCTKCKGHFVSTHEARRHVKTAARCTGKKVKCLRCGDHIHAAHYSRKRHFAAKKCQKKGRKKGVPTYTVNNAFEEL